MPTAAKIGIAALCCNFMLFIPPQSRGNKTVVLIVMSLPLPAGSALEAIPGLEDPPYRGETGAEEDGRHRKAHSDVHVGDLEEAPAEAADQIDDRVRQGDGLP